jgi:glutamate synthase domain-containing protein 3
MQKRSPTMPLIAMGCIMMRKCHLNTCPVGIATQDKELRKKFEGTAESVVNFFFFVAEEVRQLMARMGFRTFDEMIGKVDRLDTREAVNHYKSKGLDFAKVFFDPPVDRAISRYHTDGQDHGLEKQIDNQLIELCRPAIEELSPVEFAYDLRNTDRTVGTMLSHEIAKRYGAKGLPDGTIKIHFSGSAGQSFGAWASSGMTLQIRGDANDYFGKGLSGGRLVIAPPPGSSFVFEENIIIGNVAFYGATGGEAFVNGMAGERFCIRNSGASVVVEGVGDHGCEYMTNGYAVILGECGRNFAAGMSGGIAFVLDEQGDFEERCLQNAEVDVDPFDDPADLRFVRDLLERHVAHTRSPKGQWVLEHWESMTPRFKKIFPRELKRAIREREARETAQA